MLCSRSLNLKDFVFVEIYQGTYEKKKLAEFRRKREFLLVKCCMISLFFSSIDVSIACISKQCREIVIQVLKHVRRGFMSSRDKLPLLM